MNIENNNNKKNRFHFSSLILLILFSTFSLWFINAKATANDLSETKKDSITTILIDGTVQPDEALSYRLEPFQVPDGIGRMEITFEYTGKNTYSEMEIGLFDPDRFRGTSRFSKTSFFLSATRATASYHPGPLISGTWNISLGFPTIKKESTYEVTIRLIPKNHRSFMGPDETALKDTQKWYRGDFHTHTGHSDAYGCKDLQGNNGPCQVYQVVETAQNNNLDFVSITDHNTVSHHQDMTVIQPSYPDLLLIRGQEVTTFYGHANVYGTSHLIDFRVGFDDRTFRQIQQEVDSLGALLSINHPGRETGANCTGCGWSAKNTNYDQLQVVEVVNGTNVENDIAGLPFWHQLLNNGYKVTGIGGSDNHSAGFGNSQTGIPTTMVYANSLSEIDILEAVRQGKVYLKTKGSNGPEISFTAESGTKRWSVGDSIVLSSLDDQKVVFTITYTHIQKQELELIYNGDVVHNNIKRIDTKQAQKDANTEIFVYELINPEKGWLRFNLRNASNEDITVISNPIYLGVK